MRSLNNLSSKAATEAMQSINTTVYRSLFMVLFILLAIGSIVVAIWSILAYGLQESLLTLLGSLLYVFGMFMVTGRGNVPLNESLRKVDSSSSDMDRLWSNYYTKWTRFNTLRCVFGVLAGISWAISAYLLL